MRDLVRARAEFKNAERKARQELVRFCCVMGAIGRAAAGRGRMTPGWTGSVSSGTGRSGRFGTIWSRCVRRATGWRR